MGERSSVCRYVLYQAIKSGSALRPRDEIIRQSYEANSPESVLDKFLERGSIQTSGLYGICELKGSDPPEVHLFKVEKTSWLVTRYDA